MAKFGQTVFRLSGALVLAGGATLVDHDLLRNGEEIPARRLAPFDVGARFQPAGRCRRGVTPSAAWYQAPSWSPPPPPAPPGPVQRLPLHPPEKRTPYLLETTRPSSDSSRWRVPTR